MLYSSANDSAAGDPALADLMLAPPPASLPAARSETNVGPLDADDQQPPRAGSFSRELAPPSSGVAVGRSSSDRETGGKADHVRFFSPPADKKDPDSERQKIYQSISSHENIQNVPSDFGQYIVQHKVDTRLQQLRSTTGDSKSDFDRLKDYQLALHEILFACMSHVRALTVLDLLFVRTWPESCQEIMKQLGLHFVPRCIQLYKNLLECIGKPSLNEFVATGKITGFGQRLLAWYSDEQNFLNFKLLSLSFGFSRSSRSHTGSKRSTGNEDDIILRLESLRRENAELNRFIQLAEHHEAAQRLDFKAYYSMNMQFTMRMFLLLQTAVKSARKAKSSYKLAERDLPDLEKCQEKAKMVVDYSNFTSVRLKELSRQLVLSSTFKSFWVRCKLDKDHVDRVRDQISHLHTCQLVQTREVAMPGFENYRLRLLVFSEFLLIVSETEEPKGVVKYQLLRHLGQSMSVGGSGSSEASDVGNMGSLRAVSCPPIIPMPNVIHVFEGRQQKSSSSGRQPTEFRMVIDHPSTSRTESLLVVFNLRKDKPKMPFSDRETDTSASDIVESIKKLQERFKAVNINRSGSVNSIGSVTSAPAEMASGSSPLSEDAVASSTRGSTLTEEKEDDIEDQEDMPLPSLPQSEASSAGEMLHNRSDSPDSSSSPSTPIANEDSSLIVSPGSIDRAADQSQLEPLQDQPSSLSAVGVDEAQIDSLSARQLQLASELRSQLCSVLNLNPESFDAVAEFAQESDQPGTKDGVLVAYKQFEQLLETLPRLMKALLPSSEGPGAAETLLDQLTVGTGKTAKVLQQLSGLQSSDDDKENDLNDVADAGASAESVNPDQQQEAVQQVCNPTTTGVEDFPRDSQQSEQQQEQHEEQTANIEQEKHEFTDTSLAMTHSDDEGLTSSAGSRRWSTETQTPPPAAGIVSRRRSYLTPRLIRTSSATLIRNLAAPNFANPNSGVP
uniref:PH domain-containing protein n=1 Tax=Macrostomum lignano TaxID=282301 RepID=A0A1I8J811_9PLAT